MLALASHRRSHRIESEGVAFSRFSDVQGQDKATIQTKARKESNAYAANAKVWDVL